MPSVDNRIVQMQFENAQFEKGAAESLKTLTNLTKALDFDSKKGLGDLKLSVEGLDFSGIQKSVESIADRFTPIGILGQKVINNLINTAMGGLSKVTSGVSGIFTEIETRGEKRASNLEQARFQLKGLFEKELGAEKAAKRVEEIITGPVDKAVSGTRFGLDEAAVAASMLAASGITDLEKMGDALLGISGAATMTGREYGDIANIFTTVAGQGKLMTMQLRQFEASGLNVAADLAKALGKTEAQVREMVTDGKISFEQFAKVINENYGEHATKANETYSGSLANVYAQLGKIGEAYKTNYKQSMIPVNVAMITYLKALKGELGPIFNIINKRQTAKANWLENFFNDKRLLKASKNFIKTADNLYKSYEHVVNALKKSIKDNLGESDIVGKLYAISKAISAFSKNIKKFWEDAEVTSKVKSIAYNILTLGKTIKDGVIAIIKPLKDIFFEIFPQKSDMSIGLIVLTTISDALRSINTSATEATKGIKDFFGSVEVNKKLLAIFSNIVTIVGRIKGAFVDLIGPIKEAFVDTFASSSMKSGVDILTSLYKASAKIAKSVISIADSIKKANLDGTIYNIASKIFNGIKNVDDKIISVVTEFVPSVADTIGRVAKSIVNTLSGVFKIIGSGINIFEQLAEVIKPIVELAETIGDFVVKRFEDLANAIDLIGTSTKNATESVNIFTVIGKAISNFIGFITGGVDKFVKGIKAIFNAVDVDLTLSFDTFRDLLEIITKGVIFDKLFTFLDNTLNSFTTFTNVLESFTKSFKSVIDIPTKFSGALGAFAKTLNEFTKTLKVGQLLITAVAVGVLAASITLMANVDADKAGAAVASLSILMYSLTGCIKWISKLKPKSATKIVAAAIAFSIMSGAMIKLAKALATIAELDSNSLAESAVVLMLIMRSTRKMITALDGVKIKMTSMVALIIFAESMKVLVKAFANLTKVISSDLAASAIAFVAMYILIGTMVKVVERLNVISKKMDKGAIIKMVGATIALNIFVKALIPVVGAIAALTGLLHTGIGEVAGAFVIVELLMSSLVNVMKKINNVMKEGNPLKLIVGVLAIKLFVYALIPAVAAIASLAGLLHLDPGSTIGAFIIIELLMNSFVAVVNRLSNSIKGNSLTGIAGDVASMVSATESVMVLVKALAIMVGEIAALTALLALNPTATLTAFGVIELMLFSLVEVCEAANDMVRDLKDIRDIYAVIGAMSLVILAMIPMTAQIVMLAALGKRALVGLGVFDLVLISLLYSIKGLKKLASGNTDFKKVLAVIGLMGTLIAAMTLILPQVAAMSLLGPLIIAGLIGFEAVLWSMIGAVAVMNKIAKSELDVGKIIAMAGAMGVIALALSVLLPQIVALSMLGTNAIAGAGAFAIIMSTFIAAGAVAGNFPVVAAGLIALAGGITLVSAAFLIFGTAVASLGWGLNSIADGIDRLSEVSDKIDEVLANILAAINANKENISETISNIVDLSVDAVKLGLPKFIRVAQEWLIQTAKAIRETVPQVITEFTLMIVEIAQNLQENGATIITAAVDILVAIVDGLNNEMERIVDAAFRLVISFVNAFADAIDKNGPALKAAALHLVESIVGFFIGAENAKKFMNAAKTLIGNFIKGITTAVKNVITAIKNFGTKVKNAFESVFGKGSFMTAIKNIGKQVVMGFLNGITGGLAGLAVSIGGMAKTAISTVKTLLGIASPSKVFYEIGSYVIEGFVNGIDDGTASAKKQIQKAFVKMTPSLRDSININLDTNLDKANKQLSKYINKYDKLVDTRSKEKKELKGLNENLKKEFQFRKTSKKFLTKSQKAELNYLQQKLQIEGTLTDKEFKRMGTLLGLSPKQQKALEDELARRKDISKEIDKNTEKISKYKKLINELAKEIASGSVYSVGKSKKFYDAASESLMKFGESLYKNTDEYKENTAQINSNKESIKSLQNSIDDLTKKREHQQSVINGVRNSLYNYLSTGNLALEYEKKNGKLTKDAEKQRNKDIKSLEKLQGKLRENGKLSKEEYLELARLLGIKGKNLETIKAQILLLEDYSGQLNETNGDLKDAKAAVTELENANEELGDAIENGPIAKLTELRDKVKETISDALNPLKESIEDNISMFDKFSVTELAEKFDMSTLIGNVASFGNVWAQWEKDLNTFLSDSRYSDQVKQYVESLGPSAANMLKVLLAATDEEIRLTNEAFFSSQEAEVDQWLSKIESKVEAQRKFYENLKILRDAGLSDEAYRALMEEGYEAAGSIVDGLISGLGSANGDENISRLNDAYKNYLTIPEEIANQAMMDAAASFEGLGGTLYDALIKGMASGLFDQKNIDSMREGLQSFVDAVYATDEEKEETKNKGKEVGTVYIDGVAASIDENGYLVTNEAKDVGKDANKGVQQYLSASNGANIGRQMDNGLVAGLYENGGAVAAAATAVAYQAYAAAMAALAVASPSKKFAELGMYADLGFAQGLIKYTSSVTDATTSVADSSMETMRSKLSELSDTLSDSANAPVIRPILDLSGVEAGAATVKRMFESTHMSASGGAAMGDEDVVSTLGCGSNYVFNQYNTSPKALSRIDIYRQTNNQFAMFRRATT